MKKKFKLEDLDCANCAAKMEEAINAQINAEFWSAYLYLSMSCDFARKGLNLMRLWTRL